MSSQTVSASFKTSSALSKVGPSAISRMIAAVTALKAEGRDIIGLQVGEPDFDTPDNVIEAAIRAMREGDTHYTALDGTPALKKAIQGKFSRENGLEFGLDQITVTTGAKMLLFAALYATVEKGDEVIMPAPYWVNYSDIVEMLGAIPVVLQTRAQDRFILHPDALEAAITPKTRWLMINSPSNPSGSVYTAEDYHAILKVMDRHPQLWLMVDDIYEHIIYEGNEFVTPAQLRPDLQDRILTVNGVSKAYAMTGWRIGYGAGPVPLITAIRTVLSQTTSGTCSIAQAAAAEALSGPQDAVRAYLARYSKRRDLVMGEMANIPGVRCTPPPATFYAFVDWRPSIGSRTPSGEVLENDESLCNYLLHDHGVGVVPGAAFGLPGFFRLSFASSEEQLQEGMTRIRNGFAALTR